MTDLLLDTKLDPEQREYVETVKSSGNALLTIIDDILDFSKIEAGKLHLESLDVDLHGREQEHRRVTQRGRHCTLPSERIRQKSCRAL
jgi:two-component system sensor histidine kinase/response regulator